MKATKMDPTAETQLMLGGPSMQPEHREKAANIETRQDSIPPSKREHRATQQHDEVTESSTGEAIFEQVQAEEEPQHATQVQAEEEAQHATQVQAEEEAQHVTQVQAEEEAQHVTQHEVEPLNEAIDAKTRRDADTGAKGSRSEADTDTQKVPHCSS